MVSAHDVAAPCRSFCRICLLPILLHTLMYFLLCICVLLSSTRSPSHCSLPPGTARLPAHFVHHRSEDPGHRLLLLGRVLQPARPSNPTRPGISLLAHRVAPTGPRGQGTHRSASISVLCSAVARRCRSSARSRSLSASSVTLGCRGGRRISQPIRTAAAGEPRRRSRGRHASRPLPRPLALPRTTPRGACAARAAHAGNGPCLSWSL